MVSASLASYFCRFSSSPCNRNFSIWASFLRLLSSATLSRIVLALGGSGLRLASSSYLYFSSASISSYSSYGISPVSLQRSSSQTLWSLSACSLASFSSLAYFLRSSVSRFSSSIKLFLWFSLSRRARSYGFIPSSFSSASG